MMLRKVQIATAMALMLVPFCGFAAMDDVVFSYVSSSTDCYADGTPVADGECYALVFTKRGGKFGGFYPNGKLVNPEQDDVAAVAPLAKGGKCPGVAFQLPARYAALHAKDQCGVYLLDTRKADGKPSGLKDGELTRVNRFSSVPDVRVSSPTMKMPGLDVVQKGELGADGVYTLMTDEVADLSGVEKPVITDVKVANGIMYVTVENADANVTWSAVSGEKVGQIDQQEGSFDGSKKVVLEIPVDASVKFVKIMNREAVEDIAMEVK